ncbi:Antitoxin protein of toxin-antitoxin system [Balamuthia mandrillaris]
MQANSKSSPLPPPPPPPSPAVTDLHPKQKEGAAPPPPAAASPPPPPPAGGPPSPGSGERNWIPLSSSPSESSSRQAKRPLVSSASMRSTKPADITSFDWHKADGFRRSSEGSAGVFFIKSESQGMVVVKGSSTITVEAFGALLAERLEVTAPKVRVLEYTNPEWRVMKRKLFSLAKRIGENDSVKVEKELDRAFVLVMEYVPGKDLETLGPEMALKVFGGDWGRYILQQMGRIVVFDMLCNNWDRLPAVWDNDGNAKNIILSKLTAKKQNGSDEAATDSEDEEEEGWRVVAIDQGLSCINPETFRSGYDKYMNRVKEFALEVVQEKPSEGLTKIRELLRLCTAYDITEAGMAELRQGIIDGMLFAVKALSREVLQELKDQVATMVTMDWADVWASGLQQINVDFIAAVLDIFREVLDARKE